MSNIWERELAYKLALIKLGETKELEVPVETISTIMEGKSGIRVFRIARIK